MRRHAKKKECKKKEHKMKLKDLEIFVVGTPPPHWGGRYFIFVKVTTADGISGLGEVYGASVGPQAMCAVIEDVFARHMLGEDPANVERMFRRAYSAGFSQRPDPTVMGAFSGLEIACWDIVGKAQNRPIYALLGGMMNARVRSYSYLYPMAHHKTPDFWTSVDMNVEAALAMAEQGFTAIKFDPAGPYTMRGGHQPAMSDIDFSVRLCAALRDALGSRVDLLFGTHGQFTTSGAVRLGRAIAPYQPLWFEEPVPPDNIAAMAEVARAVPIPIATGERLTTKAEFAAVLRAGAANIVQPALGRAGGIWEGKKIATLAEVHNAQIAPHLYAGPIEWAANIHLAVSCANLLMVETIGTGGGFAGDLIGHAIEWQDGFIHPPSGAGLGIELDEALARANPYKGDGLHLEMQEAPCDYVKGNNFGGGVF